MRRGLFYALTIFLLVSCGKSDRFTIEGSIKGGDKKMLYLEHVGMTEITTLDSVKLSTDGEFEFKRQKPEFAPDFYRLRLDGQVINISVDSTEIINVEADTLTFAQDYKVEGSKNCQEIKVLNNCATNTKMQIEALMLKNKKKEITSAQFDSLLLKPLAEYKVEASKIIYANPKSAAAYFALFQKIYSYLIFNPSKKEDLRAFAAVATAFDVYYPNNPRSQHLKQFTLQAMKSNREPGAIQVSQESVNTRGRFEIALPDIKGNTQTLSSQMGKVVLLCFTAYQTKFSPDLNMEIGEIYAANRQKGFEVFQVSLDSDENFWKVSASNLPWKCVRDANGQYSEYARTYNVSELPTLFIINKQGDVVKRIENLKTLRSEIEKML